LTFFIIKGGKGREKRGKCLITKTQRAASSSTPFLCRPSKRKKKKKGPVFLCLPLGQGEKRGKEGGGAGQRTGVTIFPLQNNRGGKKKKKKKVFTNGKVGGSKLLKE